MRLSNDFSVVRARHKIDDHKMNGMNCIWLSCCRHVILPPPPPPPPPSLSSSSKVGMKVETKRTEREGEGEREGAREKVKRIKCDTF